MADLKRYLSPDGVYAHLDDETGALMVGMGWKVVGGGKKSAPTKPVEPEEPAEPEVVEEEPHTPEENLVEEEHEADASDDADADDFDQDFEEEPVKPAPKTRNTRPKKAAK